MNPRRQSKHYTIHICLPSTLLPTKVQALSVTCNHCPTKSVGLSTSIDYIRARSFIKSMVRVGTVNSPRPFFKRGVYSESNNAPVRK